MYYDRVAKVTLELTTKCSARCPQCARNWRGDTNPLLPQVELSLADIQRIFPQIELRWFRLINVCGSYGDATAAQDTAEIFEYLRETKPELQLDLHTHGSARSVDWWKKLAALKVNVYFGIDGLEDTNHIYRRQTNWKTIMRNASAFINAGGRATWNFIVFAHNEHQVETAEKLSQEMGFKYFIVRRTGRFRFRSDQQIFARDGKVIGKLQPPQHEDKYKNQVWTHIKEDFGTIDDYHRHLETTPIFCKATAHGGGIFINAKALVFPCCWLSQINQNPSQLKSQCEPLELLKRIPGGRSSICALTRPLSEIIHSDFFMRVIPEGWKPGADRIRTCAHQCGEYSDFYQERGLFSDH